MRLILILVVACWTSIGFAQQKVPTSQTEMQLSFVPLVKEASPAVVNIFANRIVEQRQSPFMGNPMFEDFFRSFGQSRPRVQNSLGSGVILSADGIVVSNYHVVGMATEITVVLNDRREFDARVLLGDQESDLAILKIESDEDLPWLELRDSDEVEVGELVLAIGNPFGIGQTVSSGIISGLARSGIATGNARGYFLQTDAPINPGNSGGALIDMTGALVGVNTSILTRSGGSNGVGFAIPANLVAQFVAQAKSGNDGFERPWAGVFGQSVDGDLAEGLGQIVPSGVILSAMHPLSSFKSAGLNVGDVILAIDGQEVNAPAEMLFRMSVRSIGDEIDVTYLRDGEMQNARVALIVAPDEPPANEQTVPEGVVLSGLSVANINPRVSAELGLPIDATGVVITRVPWQLQRVGLRRGDIITAINRREIENPDDVISSAADTSRGWRIDGISGGRSFSYRFRI